jgi:hypothetical protein
MRYLISISVVLFFFIGGCTVTVNDKSFEKQQLGKLHFGMLKRSEYVIIGEIEGTASVETYFWFVGSDFFEPKRNNKAGVIGSYAGSSRAEAMAIYNAIEKVDADAILAPRFESKLYTGPLGFYSSETVTVKGKALRIKTDLDLAKK